MSSAVLYKGGTYELTGKERITVSIRSEFAGSTFIVTTLDKDLNVGTIRASQKVGGVGGHFTWTQNPYRSEHMFAVELPALGDDVHHLVFFALPGKSKKDERLAMTWNLCDDQGQNRLASFEFASLNKNKAQIGAGLHRNDDGSWLFRAIGESDSEREYTAVSSTFPLYCRAPHYVFVKVIECRDLSAQDSNGKSDPYVVVRGNRTSFKTEVQKKTLSPVFLDGTWRIAYWTDEMPPPGPAHKHSIKFDVFDWDKLSKDDFMGIVEVTVADICSEEGGIDRWYPLKPDDRMKEKEKAKVKGEIHLQLKIVEK